MKKQVKKNIAGVPGGTQKSVKVAKSGLSSWVFLGGIVLLALGLYANGLHNDILTFDDNEYFQNYPEITHFSWKSVQQYFSGYYVIMYQPIPVFAFALNYHFTGLDTFPMHAFNLFFHVFCIVLVYIWMQQLTKNKMVALIVSLLFAIHPMNVEAVTWISARSSSMYTAFYLLSLIFYTRYLSSGFKKQLVLSGLMFLISLFCKAQAVTLPVVLILLDFYYHRKLLSRKVILEKIPFFILSIIFGLVTVLNEGTIHNLTNGMMISYNPLDMFFMVCYTFSFYLVKLIAPFQLCAIYVYPPKNGIWLPWEYYASFLLMSVAAVALWKNRQNRIVLFGAGFFLITIAINVQIIPSRLFIVTDRYAYMPYLGLFLIPVMLLSKLKTENIIRYNKIAPMAIGALLVFTIVGVFAVPARNKVWSTDITFLTDVIKKNPPVGYIYRAYGNRGFAYKLAGRNQEALDDFTAAIKLDSTDSRSFLNRGLVYAALQNNQAALYDLNKAEALNPNQPLIYNARSQIKFLLKDIDGAESDSKKVLELNPANTDALNTLANIAFNKKDYTSCENYLTKAITIQPEFALGYKNRGLLYLQLNRPADACSDFVQAANLGNQEAKQLKGQYCN